MEGLKKRIKKGGWTRDASDVMFRKVTLDTWAVRGIPGKNRRELQEKGSEGGGLLKYKRAEFHRLHSPGFCWAPPGCDWLDSVCDPP